MLEQLRVNKSLLNDFERLTSCLEPFDDLTVAQFCKKCEQLTADGASTKPRPAKLDDVAVSKYLDKLSACVDDRAQLESVLSTIKADKAVRIGELNEIARRYVGGTNRYRKKTDAYKDIKLRFESHIAATQRAAAASEIY